MTKSSFGSHYHHGRRLTCGSQCIQFLLFLMLFVAGSFAQVQNQDARSLIEHAKQISDIRAEGAGAFVLKAKFTATHDDGTTAEAVYTETWVSPRLWRSEVTAGDLHQTEVVKDKTLWLLSNFPTTPGITPNDIDTPETLVAFHLDDDWFAPESWKAAKIEDRSSGPWSLRCADSINEGSGRKSELCFDKTNGALVARSYTVHRAATGLEFESTCAYTNYQKFGEKTFPRSIQCVARGKRTLEGTVMELTAVGTPDSSVFVSLPGARELAHCPWQIIEPKALTSVDPSFPIGSHNSSNHVALSFTVGVDGKPRDLKVIRSGGADFDRLSIDAAKKWQFRPAICGGEPMEKEITIEVSFRRW